jgi:predicted RNA-binding protein with EMAP domain
VDKAVVEEAEDGEGVVECGIQKEEVLVNATEVETTTLKKLAFLPTRAFLWLLKDAVMVS